MRLFSKTWMLGLVALVGLSCLAQPANAEIIVEVKEQGNDVVAIGEGSLDLAGLTVDWTGYTDSLIRPAGNHAFASVGTATNANLYVNGVTSSWTNMGTGTSNTFSSASSGLLFGQSILSGQSRLWVDSSYVSGDQVSVQSTFANQSLQSLGLKRGTYTTSWANDSLSFHVVPEPSSASLLVAGMAGLLGYRRRKRASK